MKKDKPLSPFVEFLLVYGWAIFVIIIAIFGLLLFIMGVEATTIEINNTDIPINYEYNQTILLNQSGILTFFSNVSWLEFLYNPIEFTTNNISNITYNILTFKINSSFDVGTHSATLFYNYSYDNNTYYFDYNITVIEFVNISRFMQVDTTTYVYNLKSYELDDPFTDTIPITVYGNGYGFCTCTDWLRCEPYSFELTNSTIQYNINISTGEGSAGIYYHYATFWLQDPSNSSVLTETNITFIFNVVFDVEPMTALNESCNRVNMTFTEYIECMTSYYEQWEKRIRDLNNTQNITSYVENRTTTYKEVVPWNDTYTGVTIQKLIELKEIDRILKREAVENKKLQSQIEILALSNANLTARYQQAISNLPTMVADMVSALSLELEEERRRSQNMLKGSKAWEFIKTAGLWFLVIFIIIGGYIYLKTVFPFW